MALFHLLIKKFFYYEIDIAINISLHVVIFATQGRCPSYQGNKNIKRAFLSHYVWKIPSDCFRDCINLEEFYFSPKYLVGFIDDYAFFGSGLKTINIKHDVYLIGAHAFSNCQELVSVNLPEGLGFIGMNCFENCVLLEEIKIPSTVTHIGHRAFHGCRSLKKIILPKHLEKFGFDIFYGISSEAIYF
jgi:hypothetical protein